MRARMDRRVSFRWVLEGLIAFAFFALLLSFAKPVLSSPRAADGNECVAIADMALVARALAEEGLPAATIGKAMIRIYKQELIEKWLGPIVAAAVNDPRSAGQFATDLGRACLQSRGATEGFFGTGV